MKKQILKKIAGAAALCCLMLASPALPTQAEEETEAPALQVPEPPKAAAAPQVYTLNYHYADVMNITLIPASSEDEDNHDGAKGMFYCTVDDQRPEDTEGTPYEIRDGVLYLVPEGKEETLYGPITDTMILGGLKQEVVSGEVPKEDALFEAQLVSDLQTEDGSEKPCSVTWFHSDGTFQYASFVNPMYNSGTYRMENGFIKMDPGCPGSGDDYYDLDGVIYERQFIRKATGDTP